MNNVTKKNLILHEEIRTLCSELGITCITGVHMAYVAARTYRSTVPTSYMHIYEKDHEKLCAYLRAAENPDRAIELLANGEGQLPDIRYVDRNTTFIDLRDPRKYECDGINVVIRPIEYQELNAYVDRGDERSDEEVIESLMNDTEDIRFFQFTLTIPVEQKLYEKLTMPYQLTEEEKVKYIIPSFPEEVIIVDPEVPCGKALGYVDEETCCQYREKILAEFNRIQEFIEINDKRRAIMVDALKQIHDVYEEADKQAKLLAKKSKK